MAKTCTCLWSADLSTRLAEDWECEMPKHIDTEGIGRWQLVSSTYEDDWEWEDE